MTLNESDPGAETGADVLLAGEHRKDNRKTRKAQFSFERVAMPDIDLLILADSGQDAPSLVIKRGANSAFVYLTPCPREFRKWAQREFLNPDGRAMAGYVDGLSRLLIATAEAKRALNAQRRRAQWQERLSFMSREDGQ